MGSSRPTPPLQGFLHGLMASYHDCELTVAHDNAKLHNAPPREESTHSYSSSLSTSSHQESRWSSNSYESNERDLPLGASRRLRHETNSRWNVRIEGTVISVDSPSMPTRKRGSVTSNPSLSQPRARLFKQQTPVRTHHVRHYKRGSPIPLSAKSQDQCPEYKDNGH